MLAVGIVAADALTKQWALTALADGPVRIVGDLVRFRLTFNTGAAFSTGESLTVVFTVTSAVVSVALVVGILRSHSARWALALGCLLGGAAGNLVDRLTREPGFARGAVVDFVSVGSFPVFNVADAAITTAAATVAGLTFLHVQYRRPHATEPAPPGATVADPLGNEPGTGSPGAGATP